MSSVNSVNNYLATSSASGSADASNNPSSVLNQADFLKLLVAQMQNQDPMNPQSNTDMAAQMAQFSALTASTASSSSLAMIQANSLVGNTVTLQVDANDTTSGVVQGVVIQNGAPEIMVNGSLYHLNQVSEVQPTAAAATNSTNASSSQN